MVRFEQLAEMFEFLARLVEMVGDNPFKARTYRFAAAKMREIGGEEVTKEAVNELSKIKGIGKAVVEKSLQFLETGHIKKIDEFESRVSPVFFLLARDSGLSGKILNKLYAELKDLNCDEIVSILRERKEELELSEEILERLQGLCTE